MADDYLKIPYSGATPGADSNAYTLFNSATFGPFKGPSLRLWLYKRYLLSLKNSQAGTLRAYESPDGGTTWLQFAETAVPAATTAQNNQVAVMVEPHADVRIDFVNGGVAQDGTWYVGQALDDGLASYGPSTSGGGSGGAVTTTQLPATLGAKTKAGSLSVVQATDYVNPQMPAALGATTKAGSLSVALATDTGNLPTSSTQLPAALGQGTKAQSLTVTVASDQGALPVSATQLPASLGTKTAAASLPVTLASDYQLQGASTPTTAVTACTNVLPLGKYNAAQPTLTDGQFVPCQFDVNGNLKTREQLAPVAEDNTNGVIAVATLPTAVSTYAWSAAFTAALATNLVVKSGAGKLRRIDGRLDSTAATATTYYLHFLNAASLPANGAVTPLRAPLKLTTGATAADITIAVDLTNEGIYASTGIVLALSSTDNATLTIAGAFLSLTALYK